MPERWTKSKPGRAAIRHPYGTFGRMHMGTYRDCVKPPFLLLALTVLSLALAGCESRREARTLTIALAVFPDEASRYRVLLHDFENLEHVKVNLIAQSYGDILRAFLAEGTAHRGRLDIVELDLAT